MQRYQTEDEHRKAMRAKINKTIKRGRRRKRIIRRLNKAVPGICIGVLIAGMGAWCIAAPLPDPDDYEPYRFQAENGQWYTQEEYEQMSRERDAYHQREREEAEKEAQMIRDYQEQYQKDQEAEWKLYQEQTRTGLIHSMDFDASDAYLLEKIAMAEAESEDTEGKALVMLVVLNRVSARRTHTSESWKTTMWRCQKKKNLQHPAGAIQWSSTPSKKGSRWNSSGTHATSATTKKEKTRPHT